MKLVDIIGRLDENEGHYVYDKDGRLHVYNGKDNIPSELNEEEIKVLVMKNRSAIVYLRR